MKKDAIAVPIVLALTAMAFTQPAHHRAGPSTTDTGDGAPRNWNEIEASVPSGGC
jgi:hypothetical protein